MRGTIVTVLDLGVRLDPTARPPRDGIDSARSPSTTACVGVVVDEVVGRAGISRSTMRDAAARAAVIRARRGDAGRRAVVVLDLDALITQVLLS